jgi:plasmid stability protein
MIARAGVNHNAHYQTLCRGVRPSSGERIGGGPYRVSVAVGAGQFCYPDNLSSRYPDDMANKLAGVRIDPELWKRVRVRAAEEGRSASAIVSDALEAWMASAVSVRDVRRLGHDELRQKRGVNELTYDRSDS